MLDGNTFTGLVKLYHKFLVDEFGMFIKSETIRGNVFYEVQYEDEVKIISISYENIEDYLQVIMFLLNNNKLPEFDDKSKTLHLNELNSLLMKNVKKNEIDSNEKLFSTFSPNDTIQYKLIKSAKELRLCLKHFNEIPL
jgi:hypothetical protein